MATKILLFVLLVILNTTAFSQSVGVGTTSPSPSAKLDVSSNTSGLLLPRMTTTERKAIVNPAVGLLVFDVDKSALYTYDGSTWFPLQTAASAFTPPITKTVTDASPGDSLGLSVAISGDYAIAGAPGDDVGTNNDQGSAYIFFRQNGVWVEQAKITSSDGAAGDLFGFCVAISGDYAIIGAFNDDVGFSNQGSAYIFSRTGTIWSQQAKLVAPTPAADDWFGYSVGISGDYAVVSSLQDDIAVNDQGSAFVFFRSGTSWTQQAYLQTTAPVAADNFGSSVSISGDYLVIGAYKRDTLIGATLYQNLGNVYVYVRNGTNWTVHSTLPNNSLQHFLEFGRTVCLRGDYIVVGNGGNSPSVWTYKRSGASWVLGGVGSQGLSGGDQFGFSVAITPQFIVACAPFFDNGISFSDFGVAFVFSNTPGIHPLLRRLMDNTPVSLSRFGYSCGLDGYNIVFGQPFKNGKGEIQFLNVE